MKEILEKLNRFLGEAAANTYAGGGQEMDPELAEKGMKELEYGKPKDEWYYKDSYAGFFQSWGREVVWHNGKPFWVQIYGGGMESKYYKDTKFVHETFNFLKKALSTGDKLNQFQPRGPKQFEDGDWSYKSEMQGDITKFRGSENIKFKGDIVFSHNFSGGLYIYKE